MVSHKHGLGVSITDRRGLHVFFRKNPTNFNICVGDHMKGVKAKGKSAIRTEFIKAVGACKGRRA
jgi:hypothetical protein